MMKLKNNIDLVAFLQAVRSCREDVYFCTREGDRIDLKSVLSEYVFSSLTVQPRLLETGWIEASPADQERLMIFAA